MTRRRLLTAALLLLLIPALCFAQTPVPITIGFYGTIDTNLNGTLIINGRVVDIRSAEMNGLLLAPGITVHIQAEVAPDGSLVAREIDLVPVGLVPGLVEINGIVTEFSGSSLRMGNQVIDLASARLIGTITVGQTAIVFASATHPNLWDARLVLSSDSAAPIPPVSTPEVVPSSEAHVVIPPAATPEIVPGADVPVVVPPVSTPEVSDDFRVEGRLEAVGSNAVVVDGQTYDISSARIDDPLTVGAFVRMEVYVANGVFVVERIRIEDDD